MDLNKFQLRRINPFQGLVIDADIWQDAHKYHRDLLRLHLLAFHQTGVVDGLRVVASEPADLSVNIQPGIAVDADGNIIVVPQAQRYKLQTRKKGTVYLILQYREVPAEPYQPPNGGQPTRLLDAYKIEERDKLPDCVCVELARIAFDPSPGAIKDARDASHPGTNELNLTFRPEVNRPPVAPAPEKASPPVTPGSSTTREKVMVGHTVLGDASKDLNVAGLKNLANQMSLQGDFSVGLDENISLSRDLGRYTMLYLTGNSKFETTEDLQTAIAGFLKAGGVVLGDGCGEGQEGVKGIKDFGMAFNRLASQLNCKLGLVQRGHPLLSAFHVFSEAPPGAETAMLMEGGNMIYSASDYGCAWQGGHQAQPLPRDVIRGSFEMGMNLIHYARMSKAAKH